VAGVYDIHLSVSHLPAQADDQVRDTTVGDILC
jgi:hypothetical protein